MTEADFFDLFYAQKALYGWTRFAPKGPSSQTRKAAGRYERPLKQLDQEANSTVESQSDRLSERHVIGTVC